MTPKKPKSLEKSVPAKKDYKGLGWFFLPVAFVCGALGNALGDMILICAVYGKAAYFENGLRIVKHKPYTLSTGTILSGNLRFIGWLLDAAIWIFLTLLFMWLSGELVAMFNRTRKSK